MNRADIPATSVVARVLESKQNFSSAKTLDALAEIYAWCLIRDEEVALKKERRQLRRRLVGLLEASDVSP